MVKFKCLNDLLPAASGGVSGRSAKKKHYTWSFIPAPRGGVFRPTDKQKINSLPKIPGVYAFKQEKEFLYIGKAVNIRERVKNHFSFTPTPKLGVGASPNFKDNVFVPQTTHIGYIATGSEIEALLLEAELIKKFQPKYNTMWRDDKSHCYVAISQEEFPRILIVHQKDIATNFQSFTSLRTSFSIFNFQSNSKSQFSKKIQQIGLKESRIKNQELRKKTKLNSLFIIHNSEFIGPFVDGKALKQTLRVLRRVFPYRTCNKMPKKPCLYKELNLCLAPCQKKNQELRIKNYEKNYTKNIKNLMAVLKGQKNSVIKDLQKEMRQASQEQDFEKAKELRDQIFALENVFLHSHILQRTPKGAKLLLEKELSSFWQKLLGVKTRIKRIEGYDVSNIQGKQATGSMVVFENGLLNKNEYRKFHIKIEGKPNDTAMIKEIISRRLRHKEWRIPQVILIDGGRAQLNAAIIALKSEIRNPRRRASSLRGRPKSETIPNFQNPKFKKIKIISIAKRKNELFIENKEKPVLLKNLPQETANLLLRIRDEAHRFAISYHKKLRSKNFIQ